MIGQKYTNWCNGILQFFIIIINYIINKLYLVYSVMNSSYA